MIDPIRASDLEAKVQQDLADALGMVPYRVGDYERIWRERRAKRLGVPWFCAVVKQNPRRGGIPYHERWPVPRPERIHHVVSCVFKRGFRHYAFNSQSQRDEFVNAWPTAEVCEDPVP